MEFLILAHVKLGMERKVVDKLRDIGFKAWLVSGLYDIVIQMEVKDIKEYAENMVDKVRKLECIKDTTSLFKVYPESK